MSFTLRIFSILGNGKWHAGPTEEGRQHILTFDVGIPSECFGHNTKNAYKFNHCTGHFLLQILLIFEYLHGNQVYFAQRGKEAKWTEADHSATVVGKCLRHLYRVT